MQKRKIKNLELMDWLHSALVAKQSLYYYQQSHYRNFLLGK